MSSIGDDPKVRLIATVECEPTARDSTAYPVRRDYGPSTPAIYVRIRGLIQVGLCWGCGREILSVRG